MRRAIEPLRAKRNSLVRIKETQGSQRRGIILGRKPTDANV